MPGSVVTKVLKRGGQGREGWGDQDPDSIRCVRSTLIQLFLHDNCHETACILKYGLTLAGPIPLVGPPLSTPLDGPLCVGSAPHHHHHRPIYMLYSPPFCPSLPPLTYLQAHHPFHPLSHSFPRCDNGPMVPSRHWTLHHHLHRPHPPSVGHQHVDYGGQVSLLQNCLCPLHGCF